MFVSFLFDGNIASWFWFPRLDHCPNIITGVDRLLLEHRDKFRNDYRINDAKFALENKCWLSAVTPTSYYKFDELLIPYSGGPFNFVLSTRIQAGLLKIDYEKWDSPLWICLQFSLGMNSRHLWLHCKRWNPSCRRLFQCSLTWMHFLHTTQVYFGN